MATNRIELQNYPGLVFLEEPHEYYLDGVQLEGITHVIHKLFPTEYSSVPQRILDAAKNYGKTTHKKLEDHDVLWKTDPESVELSDYISICKEHNLIHAASELLVSDGVRYASAIDKVYRVANSPDTFSIADIKCLYGKITGEKLLRCRWQLSIYKMLFLQNFPGAKVDKLYIIHLYNKQKKADGSWNHTSELIEVDPIPEEYCKKLLDCGGEGFQDPFSIPKELSSKIKQLRQLIETMNSAKEAIDSIKADILESMTILDVKSWIQNDVQLTRKLPSTRSSFDLKLFKAGHPEISDYDSYMKTSNIEASLMVKVA